MAQEAELGRCAQMRAPMTMSKRPPAIRTPFRSPTEPRKQGQSARRRRGRSRGDGESDDAFFRVDEQVDPGEPAHEAQQEASEQAPSAGRERGDESNAPLHEQEVPSRIAMETAATAGQMIAIRPSTISTAPSKMKSVDLEGM